MRSKGASQRQPRPSFVVAPGLEPCFLSSSGQSDAPPRQTWCWRCKEGHRRAREVDDGIAQTTAAALVGYLLPPHRKTPTRALRMAPQTSFDSFFNNPIMAARCQDLQRSLLAEGVLCEVCRSGGARGGVLTVPEETELFLLLEGCRSPIAPRIRDMFAILRDFKVVWMSTLPLQIRRAGFHSVSSTPAQTIASTFEDAPTVKAGDPMTPVG